MTRRVLTLIVLLTLTGLAACQSAAPEPTATRVPTATPAPPTPLSADEVVIAVGESNARALLAYNMATGEQRTLIANVRRVIGDGGFASVPARSPDGRMLATARNVIRNTAGGFTTDNAGIWVSDLDGGNLREVTAPEGNAKYSGPQWSRDGLRLSFTSSLGGGQIMVVDVAGGEVSRLLPQGIDGRNAVWSPDGTKLLYSDERRTAERVLTRGIYVYDFGTETETPVYVQSDVTLLGPSWSPDGTQITFIRNGYTKDLQEVYVVTLATGEALNLTPGQAWAYNPQFSPDGLSMAFTDYDTTDKTYHLATLALDGSGERTRLLELSDNRAGPDWN